ncbi:hypothetical protein [Lysinibacillus sp. BW-2-10]|uniref:hypothetical protein n=1 Tax=Lysinibacillus sp. BW-2-10 TaxID=2590030 RepID=UPI00117DD0C2|nr:hypothetical protein [Lysinibacillus sp. BW-2-10]TSI09686.1 hypothetical protein FJQ64_04730 [Lysinibacillus sp. BW-2-10]
MFKKSFIGTVLALTISTVGSAEPLEKMELKSEYQEGISQQSVYEERIKMLELSIIPTTPRETVEVFAKAVKERNGAVQYALLSKDEQEKVYTTLAANHWVTGVSSPWVETYKIISEKELKSKKQMEYVVEFNLFTSTGKAGTDLARLTLEKSGEQWLIKKIERATKESVGIWKTYNEVDTSHIEQQFQTMKTYTSTRGVTLQLPEEIMNKINIEEGSCTNEESNPPCTFFYYKDEKQKKNVMLFALLHLSEQHLKSSYYQEHPFMTFVGKNKNDTIYYVAPSEHPYGENEQSKEGKEWSQLINQLIERVKSI